MAQQLIRQALIEIEGALRRSRALGVALADGTQTRATTLASLLPPQVGEDIWRRARHVRGELDQRLDGIERELRGQAGLLEGVLLRDTFCATLGGAEEPGVALGAGRPRNEDRAGIVVDVRGRQVGWVFDGARCYSGYSCEHDQHWFGDHFSEAIADIANGDDGDDVRGVLEDALTRVAEQHRAAGCSEGPLVEQWGTVAIARLDGNEAELVVVCDCKIAVRRTGGEWDLIEDDRMISALTDESNGALRDAYVKRYEEHQTTQAEFEDTFRRWINNQQGRHQDQSFWVVTPDDPQCAWNSIYRRMTVSADDGIVLMTSDGVDLPIDGDWSRTAKAVSQGALSAVRAARADRGPSTNPNHAMPYPDMTVVALKPRPTPPWAVGNSAS